MRKLVRGLVLGFVLSIPVFSFPAWAGVGVWTPVGGVQPYSRLVAEPGDPRTFYALAGLRSPDDSYALWRSTDGGETWRSIQEGIGPVRLLAVDPLQPRRIYAWTVSESLQLKLWVSEDRGDTWTLRYAAVPNSPNFWQILASPIREGVLYAWASSPTVYAGADVYRSTDGGATWTLRGTVGTSPGAPQPLYHHPTRKRLEYFDGAGFYTSNDDGLTWTMRSTFRGQGFYSSMARSAAAPDRLYAIPAEGCLVRSDDGGTHWKKTRSFPALPPGVETACRNVSVDPADPDHIVLMAEAGWRGDYVCLFSISRDGGATWSEPRSLPGTFVLPTGDGSGTLLAAGDSRFAQDGPFRSTDGGLSWTPSWKGIAFGDFRGGFVALPSAGPAPVLVAAVDGRVLRSEDGGAAWETVALPYGYLPPFGDQQVVADADGRTLYVPWWDESRDRMLTLKSTDGGLTWEEISKVSFGGLLAADPFLPGRLFAGDDEFGSEGPIMVWRSIDGGKSWARRSAGLPTACEHYGSVDHCPGFYAMTSDPRDPKRVVISYGDFYSDVPGIFVSTNGGFSWRRAAQGPPMHVYSLAADPAAPGVFLAGTLHGIYRSVDGADRWAPLRPGLPVDAPVLQLLRDGRSGAWYAVTDSRGIFRSTDGGTTWTGINAGLPDLSRPVIALDPQAPDRLFAAVNGQGVWSWSAPGS